MKKVNLNLSTVVMTAMVLNPCFTVAQEEVTIGKQVWMTKNLDVSTFRNGDPIPHAETNEEWKKAGENKQPAWCYYDNDPANGAKYGKLYNWYAVNDPRGLAPKGWEIPSDEDWTLLTDYLGGSEKAGAKMKSKNGWADGGSGTNSSGFSGLPGGYRNYDGTFNYFGKGGFWWSSTETNTSYAWYRSLDYGFSDVGSLNIIKTDGLSVRCLRDGDAVKYLVDDAAETTEEVGDAMEEAVDDAGDDAGDDVYKEVTSGNQVWMAGNLNVDKFRNGDPIPEAKTIEEWRRAGENGQPAWCYYDNDPANGEKYGKLYNWYAVNDSRGLAPVGYHIPSDKEWLVFRDYLRGQDVANEWGILYLSGGYRSYFSGRFSGIEERGKWWSSTEYGTFSAFYYFQKYINGIINRNYDLKGDGYSVRCLRDGDAAKYLVDDAAETTEEASDAMEEAVDEVGEVVYKEATIGNQVWMVENLNVDKFRNGDPIPEAKTKKEWLVASENKQPAWCYYHNDPANGAKYGKLYNWYAVNDPRGLAPEGWEIPSSEDWTRLTEFLGGKSVAGKKMKSSEWADYDGESDNGTNESGFSGLPGGYRSSRGTFSYTGRNAHWWSSSTTTFESFYHFLIHNSSYARSGTEIRGYGMSVRCIRE